MSRNAFDVVVGARSIVIAELTVAELVKCARGAGMTGGAYSATEAKMAGLRMAIRKIDEEAVSFNDLDGKLWDKRFNVGATLSLMNAFDQIHDSAGGEVLAALTAAVVTDGPDGVRTSVMVDGKVVVLAPLSFPAFQAALAAGDKETTPSAKEYAIGIDTVRRSIVSIDGVPPVWDLDLAAWPFTARSTALLMGVTSDINGIDSATRPTVVAST